MKVKENAHFETETCKLACGFDREINKKQKLHLDLDFTAPVNQIILTEDIL